MKTGTHPMQTRLKLFLDWGITFDKVYQTEQKANRKVHYADKGELEQNILKAFAQKKSQKQTPPVTENRKPPNGMDQTPQMQKKDYSANKASQKMKHEERG